MITQDKKKKVQEPFLVSEYGQESDSSTTPAKSEAFDFSDVDEILKQKPTFEPQDIATEPSSVLEEELDFSDVDNILSDTSIQNSSQEEEFDFSEVTEILNVDIYEQDEVERIYTPDPSIKNLIPIDDWKENLNYEQTLAYNISQQYVPKVDVKNPFRVMKPNKITINTLRAINSEGEPFAIPANESARPSTDDVINTALMQISPRLVDARRRYKKETGRDLVILSSQPQLKFENDAWITEFAFTEASARVINTYAKYGLEAAKDEGRKVSQEYTEYKKAYNKEVERINTYAKERPYLSAISHGIDDARIAYAQLAHNAAKLPQALAISARYGFDSPQYDELIRQDREEQLALFAASESIPEDKTSTTKLTRGLTSVVGSVPKLIASGNALPLVMFLENAHRGAGEASKEAFAAIPQIAAGRLTSGFFNERVVESGFSLGSRIARQGVSRTSEGTMNALADFVVHPEVYMNGNISLADKLVNLETAFAAGFAFPIGRVKGNSLVSTPAEILAPRELPPALLDVPITKDVGVYKTNPDNPLILEPAGVENREVGNWRGNWDDVVLNYLSLKKAKEEGSYKTGKLGDDVNRLSNLNKSIEALENILPKEWIEFVSENEAAIRLAKQGGAQRQAFKSQVEGLRKTGKISIEEEKLSTFDMLDFMQEGNSIFGSQGRDNKFVTQTDAAKDLLNMKASAKDIYSGKINDATRLLGWMAENAPRATRLAAFYIEAGIRDFSEFANRLKNDLGEAVYNALGDNRIAKLFEDGNKYYEGNNADPFFSGLKQNIVERFPDGNVNANTAKNLIEKLGSATEIEWTSGLLDYLDDAVRNNKKVSKNKLLEIVNEGQVKVDEKILGDELTSLEEERLLSLAHKEEAEGLSIGEQTELLALEKRKTNDPQPTRYDLKSYTSEKLELEGGENPKEVLLRVPRKVGVPSLGFAAFLDSKFGYNVETFKSLSRFDQKNLEKSYRASGHSGDLYIDGSHGEVYQTDHWQQGNVVAHFRANERTTTDNLNVFHSEEFQSDWNQQGRKEGYKEEIAEPFEVYTRKRETVIARFKTKQEAIKFIQDDFQKEGFDRLDWVDVRTEKEVGTVPKNPFMENNWKELAFKRFLRMGIETGKDGISWTTARQQQERYHKIAESKTIIWDKVGDNKYNLVLETPTGQFSLDEFKGISIDKIKELTNGEVVNTIIRDEKRAIGPAGGTIELKDTIKLGSGYSDYDSYFVKLAKKIGKKFGAEYKIKEIETSIDKIPNLEVQFDEEANTYDIYSNDSYEVIAQFDSNKEAQDYISNNKKSEIEQVHYLEITPSMRESLKQGFPLYGTSLPDLPIQARKSGIRNQLVPREEFNSILSDIVSAFDVETSENGTVFNSGLNPSSFAHQARLLYKGYKNFQSFADQIARDFGDEIRPYVDKIWDFVKQFDADESGRLTITPSETTKGRIRAIKDTSRNVVGNLARSITLAQFNSDFRNVYEGMRDVRLLLNGYSSTLINTIRDAREIAGQSFGGIRGKANPKVAEAVYKGNELQKVYTDPELTTLFGLDANGIEAYKKIRKAQDEVLNLREKQETYKYYKKLPRLAPGSAAHTAAVTKITEIQAHYNQLRDEGYISLQRRGRIGIYAEDASFPVGDPQRKIYTHAKNWREAAIIEKDFKRQGFINYKADSIRKLSKDMAFMRQLTPGQIEDLIASSGANLHDPQIQKIRDEVLSRYSSYGYKIKRNYTRGYAISWKNLLDTMIHQAEVYSSSFYNEIARDNAMDMLNSSGLASSDTIMYNLTKSYIEDETTPPSQNIGNIISAKARTITYMMQMGLDVTQFFLNTLQPVITTYSHLAKTDQTGLKFVQPEATFVKASAMTSALFANRATSKLKLTPKILTPEFMRMYNLAKDQDVVAAELTESLASSELGVGTKLQKLSSATSVFMKAGEKVARTHAFAAGFLVGKKKGLVGKQLYDFAVDTVKQTQGEQSAGGENPRFIRQAGELGKLFYQFGSFTQIWFENLATAAKSDFKTKKLKGFAGGATSRHLGALGIVAGVTGLPLSSALRAMLAIIYEEDTKDEIERWTKKNLEEHMSPENANITKNIALYGLSSKAGISARLGIKFPILDTAVDTFTTNPDFIDNIPAIRTVSDIAKAPKDFLSGDTLRGFEGISPRVARNVIKTIRFANEGMRERRTFGEGGRGDMIIPPGRLGFPSRKEFVEEGVRNPRYIPSYTSPEILKFPDFLLSNFGVQPPRVSNEYEEKKFDALGTISKKTKRSAKRLSRRLLN